MAKSRLEELSLLRVGQPPILGAIAALLSARCLDLSCYTAELNILMVIIVLHRRSSSNSVADSVLALPRLVRFGFGAGGTSAGSSVTSSYSASIVVVPASICRRF